MEDEAETYRHWDHILGLEEIFLKIISKLHWLRIGDKNNKTFHKVAVVQAAKNTNADEEIKAEDEGFFRDFFNIYRMITMVSLLNL